jgi:hypothetical protein
MQCVLWRIRLTTVLSLPGITCELVRPLHLARGRWCRLLCIVLEWPFSNVGLMILINICASHSELARKPHHLCFSPRCNIRGRHHLLRPSTSVYQKHTTDGRNIPWGKYVMYRVLMKKVAGIVSWGRVRSSNLV